MKQRVGRREGKEDPEQGRSRPKRCTTTADQVAERHSGIVLPAVLTASRWAQRPRCTSKNSSVFGADQDPADKRTRPTGSQRKNSPAQQVVHMQASPVGEVGSGETEPCP